MFDHRWRQSQMKLNGEIESLLRFLQMEEQLFYSYTNWDPRLLVNPSLSWVTIQHECKVVQNIGWRPDWILSEHCPKCVFEDLSLSLS